MFVAVTSSNNSFPMNNYTVCQYYSFVVCDECHHNIFSQSGPQITKRHCAPAHLGSEESPYKVSTNNFDILAIQFCAYSS